MLVRQLPYALLGQRLERLLEIKVTLNRIVHRFSCNYRSGHLGKCHNITMLIVPVIYIGWNHFQQSNVRIFFSALEPGLQDWLPKLINFSLIGADFSYAVYVKESGIGTLLEQHMGKRITGDLVVFCAVFHAHKP